jgi:hypothetical protein
MILSCGYFIYLYFYCRHFDSMPFLFLTQNTFFLYHSRLRSSSERFLNRFMTINSYKIVVYLAYSLVTNETFYAVPLSSFHCLFLLFSLLIFFFIVFFVSCVNIYYCHSLFILAVSQRIN